MDFYIPFTSYEKKYRYKYLALYHALRESMLSGQLKTGSKLPSTRELASLYDISRGIVNQVYEMLASEGYVSSQVGQGTFITLDSRSILGIQNKQDSPPKLSNWAKRVQLTRNQVELVDTDMAVEFTLGVPDWRSFPIKAWNHCLFEQVRQSTEKQRSEAYNVAGNLALREAIAQHLRRTRGIAAKVEQIAIVNGSMQAIALLMQLLVDETEGVVIENPGYVGMKRAVLASGGHLIAERVDQQGIQVKNWNAKLAMVTPSRQYPTGVVMSLDRRLELLRWAEHNNAFIIEDDYDSEFRYKSRAIEPLKTLDQEDRVIYIGTFSKTMMTDLRIGYVILPDSLVKPFVQARSLYEPHPTSILEQRALAEFMRSGQYEKHLRKMKRIYARKHDFLYSLLHNQLGNLFNFVDADAGLHIFAKWKLDKNQYHDYLEQCKRRGVKWSDSTENDFNNKEPSACFGFSHLTEEEMKQGVSYLVEVKNNWK